MISESFVKKLWFVMTVLISLHSLSLLMGHPIWQFERLFDPAQEANIPTWFSSTLWLAAAVTACQCLEFVRSDRERKVWLIAAAGFLIFSIDETAMIHENIGKILPHHFFPPEFHTTFRATSWPITTAPLLIGLVIWCLTIFRKVLRGSHHAAGLLGGGFFAVFAGGYGLEMTTNLLNHGTLQWLWNIEEIVEESLEMAGILMMISGLLVHRRFLEERCREEFAAARDRGAMLVTGRIG